MTRTVLFLILASLSMVVRAQDTMEKVMEKRAREMHRVIGLNDIDQWKKFIRENYTQRLIDKPMQSRTETSDNGNTSSTSSETKSGDNIEAKAMLFGRLHADFATSEIISVKPMGEKLEMVVKGEMITGTFRLTFEPDSPYRIDGLGIEAGN